MKKIIIFLVLNLFLISKGFTNTHTPEIVYSCKKKSSQKIDYYGFQKINDKFLISRYNHKDKKFYSSYSVLYKDQNNIMWDYYSPRGLIVTYYFRAIDFSKDIINSDKIILSTSNKKFIKEISKFGKQQDLLKFKGDDSQDHYDEVFKLNDKFVIFKANLVKDSSFTKSDMGIPSRTCTRGFIEN